jgi:putative nucleotidyltransferase with HDIG domain
MIPSREQCLDILEEHNVPENIRRHSFRVNEVAVFIARKLKEKGIDIDVKLVDRASLLHDLDKIPTLSEIHRHGKMAAEMLEEKGISREIQKIIINHPPGGNFENWETKVVNYADKRVTHDQIVSLKERFEYARKTYPEYHDINLEKRYYELEKEIFGIIGMKPDDLEEEVI